MEIKVLKTVLEAANNELELVKDDKNIIEKGLIEKETYVTINTIDISVRLLSYILKNSTTLANKTKAALSMELLENDFSDTKTSDVWETKIYKLADIIECFTRIGIKKFNADILFNKSWFPVILKPKFIPGTRNHEAHVNIQINVNIGNEYIDIGFDIYKQPLQDIYGKNKKPSLKELFSLFGCRPQICDLERREELLSILEEIKTTNKQMRFRGYGVSISSNHRSYYSFQSISLGNEKNFDKVIIESDLEYNDNSIRSSEINKDDYIKMPLIRIFSLSQKKYYFVSVEYLLEYEYDEDAHKRLFLPDNITGILTTVFSSPVDDLVGDIIDNKHGGMIVLASGKPGIGKTSTAEVYSEMQKTPLYAIDIAELGTNVEGIEKNITTIFRRVEKWKAIVLFDEVDVFLAKRDKKDLNRTAIVGVFLRLMDYFRGVMFFTSNKPEVLDFAILSRITLKIKYPDLDKETRTKIWFEKTSKANLDIKGGFSKVSQIELNGREIRNMTRLAKVVFPNGTNQEKLIELIELTK